MGSFVRNLILSTQNMYTNTVVSLLNNFGLPSLSIKYLVIGLMHLAIFVVDMWWPMGEGQMESTVSSSVIPLVLGLLGNNSSDTLGFRENSTLREILIREIIKDL